MRLRRVGSAVRRVATFWRRGRTCLDCGFLTYETNRADDQPGPIVRQEAIQWVRVMVARKGHDGWFTKDTSVNCYKHLWDWADEAPINIIQFETSLSRSNCPGYLEYTPGRSPEEYLKLEDEHRAFGYQWRLAIVSFFGGLLGALLGAWAALKGN